MKEPVVVAIARQAEPGAVSLFSSEGVPGVALSPDEILDLGERFLELTQGVVGAVAPPMADWLGEQPRVAEVFCRQAVVPLAHFLLDRLMRLHRLEGRHPGGFRVAQAPPLRPFDDIQRFETFATYSVTFNQSALCWIADRWNLGTGPSLRDPEPYGLPATRAGFVNYNFAGSAIIDKVRKRALRYASRVARVVGRPWRGRIPTHSMAYHTSALEARGFYGRRGFERLDFAFDPADRLPVDPALRRRLFRETLPGYASAVERFLSAVGVDSPERRRLAPEMLADFLSLMMPCNLLESVSRGLERARSMLEPFRGRPLVLAEVGHLPSLYLVAAARSLGMEVIGCQHGGGYAQMDLSRMLKTVTGEFACYDRFITWGWRRTPRDLSGRGIRTVPLPCPWLDERVRTWRKRLGRGGPSEGRLSHDILFMCERISTFPGPGFGPEVLRTDQLPEHTALLKSLVTESARCGIRMLHKPYEQQTVQMLQGLFEELERLGGGHYERLRRLDKGLDPELVRRCRLVLTTRPGTTFLECLAAGIPHMILWPSYIIREAPSARRVFSDLEECGIVHHDPAGFCRAYLEFRASPRAWMEEPRRVKAVRRFLRTYGWSRRDWPDYWRRFVDSLSRPVGRAKNHV